EMLKKDIIISDWASYDFTGLNDLKPEMIKEATAKAREAAQQFADNCGSSLGKIKTASQGQFSIEDLDETTDYIKKVRVVTSVTYYLK
ncbi:MAG: SIMPL domain-containing protein, partial [Bacteroidales bacterium]|nr:SIMPL domain-containing protein [Bacteroidales bacterium]